MSEIPWYLGQYDRRNYQSYLKAVAQETPNGWRTIDSKKLFPRTGEVEFNDADELRLRKGEWAAFQVGPGPAERCRRNAPVVFIPITIYLSGSLYWKHVAY